MSSLTRRIEKARRAAGHIPNDSYRCGVCRDVFVRGWTDDKPEPHDSENVVVCDPCNEAMSIWFAGREVQS